MIIIHYFKHVCIFKTSDDLITMWGKLQGAFDRLSKVNQTGEDLATYKPKRFNYSRPEFLQLNDDEVQVCQDVYTRPIIIPRDEMLLPRTSGYAEYEF